MKDEQKIKLFEEVPVAKAVMTMSVPTIISSLVMVIYNLADTYFVGMINDPVQNAAVALAAPVLLAFNAVNNLFGVGSASMMSRSLGKKDYDMVYKSSAFGFYCALMGGALFSLLYTVFRQPVLTLLGSDADTAAATGAYLRWTVTCGAIPAILNVVIAHLVRAEGSSLHASIGTMSGCFLNIILDPVFILPSGLNMGAAGAGLATFLSNCAACLYFFVLMYIKRDRTYVCMKPSMFRPDKTIVTNVCSVGIPASIQNLLAVTGMTVLNNFTSSYGSYAVAAMGIAKKIDMVPMYVSQGLSQGIMPLVSYNYASKNIKRMKKTVIFSARIAVSFLTAIAVCYYFGSEFFIRLFMDDDVIVSYGSRFLHALCLSLPFLCMDFLAVGVYQACGMGRKSLIFAIFRKIVLEIPALYLLNKLYPLYGLAFAQLTAELVLATAAVVVLFRMFRRLDADDSSIAGIDKNRHIP